MLVITTVRLYCVCVNEMVHSIVIVMENIRVRTLVPARSFLGFLCLTPHLLLFRCLLYHLCSHA